MWSGLFDPAAWMSDGRGYPHAEVEARAGEEHPNTLALLNRPMTCCIPKRPPAMTHLLRLETWIADRVVLITTVHQFRHDNVIDGNTVGHYGNNIAYMTSDVSMGAVHLSGGESSWQLEHVFRCWRASR